jgi:ADP-heptose:LPS heptosyltransferase
MNILDRIKQDANALVILTDWLGKRGEAAPKELAQARADVCKTCPFNQRGGRLEAAVARTILEQETVRSKIGAEVDGENNLKTCQKCGCYLKLKVWVPMRHLRPRSRLADFPAHCWMRTENARPEPTVSAVAPQKKSISIKRSAAHGDVIAASILASKLHENGYEVTFVTNDHCLQTLQGHPHIAHVTTQGAPDIDLDGSYEKNIERNRKHVVDLFIDAVHQVPNRDLLTRFNYRAQLRVSDGERATARTMFRRAKLGDGKHVILIRRSASWPSRQISPESFNVIVAALRDAGVTVWTTVADMVPGSGARPMKWVKSFRDLMGAIAVCDLLITPDTGPMHVGAALGVPMVVVEQSIDVRLRLNDQTDYVRVATYLDCSPCNEFTCPINPGKPPCQNVFVDKVVNEAKRRLNRPKVSAIIPTMSGERRLPAVVAPLDAYELIVTGDGNYSGPADLPSTRQRLGYGKTCNRGARASTGEWLLFLNDDCYLAPDAVEKMLEAATDDTGVVGCLLRYSDGRIWHGGMVRIPGQFGHIDHGKTTPSINRVVEMEAVTFAAALVRRKAFYEVGGFDERYDCYCEDTDLCLRIRERGWKVKYTPFAEGVHDESQTTSPMKQELHRKSDALFKARWKDYFG